MTVKTSSERTNLSDRAGGSAKLADAADLTNGVVAKSANVESTTLYLSVSGAVNVTVEVSPDGGETWYVLPESPVSFDGENDTTIDIAYNHNRLRLTSTDGAVDVTAQVREVV